MKKYSTDTVDYKKFRPHGSVSFSLHDTNIVIYQATGPFNVEFLDALKAIEPEVLEKVKHDASRWGEIVCFTGSCLTSDDVFKELRTYFEDMKRNDLLPVVTAYVLPDHIEGSSFMKPKYQDCFDDVGMPLMFFETLEKAIVWVKSCLQ